MEIIALTPELKDQWDEVVNASDDAWLFHLYDWQRFNEEVWGLQSQSFLVEHQGCFIAVFPLQMKTNKSLLSTVMGFGGAAVCKDVPEGVRQKALQVIYAHVESIGYQNKSPYIEVFLPPLARSSLNNLRHVNPLVHYGYEDVSTHTWMVDLTQTEEELLKNLSYDARRNIKRAEDKGYTLRKVSTISEMDRYYQTHCENYERTGAQPHPKKYFLEIYKNICQKGYAVIWEAVSAEGESVAFEMISLFKEGAYYWSGCSKDAHLDSGINYLLQYHSMLWAKEQGAKWFENGEAFPNAQDKKLKGLTLFKGKFGGELHRSYKGKRVLQNIQQNLSPFRQWLRSTSRLLESVLGKKFVRRLTNCIKGFVFYCRLQKKIFFLKPYWGFYEIFGGLLGRKKNIESLIIKIKQKFSMNGSIVLTSSGRTAFELALKVLKKQSPERNKVIISTYGCRGIFDPVIRTGLIPVFVDMDENLNVDQKALKQLLEKHNDVLAVLLPHIGGCWADIQDVRCMAKEKGIIVIEDVCQGMGLKQHNDYVGMQSDMAIFSFSIGKNLMATAGGMLHSHILKEELNAEAVCLGREDPPIVKQRFRNIFWQYFCKGPAGYLQAFSNAYEYNGLHSMDAFLLDKQLDRLEDIIQRRKKNAQRIKTALKNSGLKTFVPDATEHIYTKLSVIFENNRDCQLLCETLNQSNIETEDMYTPLHLRDIATEFVVEGECRYAQRTYKNIFNIPVRPNLTKKQLKKIIKVIKNVKTRRH
ncbi:hypothetical protein MNBD_GAMMA03-2080 [hydrothermal vent metagenome]|uniref:BioF2-like acetyltransferase domain-containing protein n=1 Tax=hydrothermal vent metagenome TaxID=652676 RepID=A0A3B0W7L4_9ZZZZ